MSGPPRVDGNQPNYNPNQQVQTDKTAVKELPKREQNETKVKTDAASQDVVVAENNSNAKALTSEERFATALARIEKLEKDLTSTQAKLQQVEGELVGAKSELTTKMDTQVFTEAEDKRVEEDRKKGWLGRALTDIMKIFARMFSPMFSVVSLGLRLLKLAWTGLIKREKINWKVEGPRLLADTVGAATALGGFLAAGPFGGMIWGQATWGGLASAAVHTYLDVKDEDGDKMKSGIAVAWEKGVDFLKGAKDDVVGLVSGKVPAKTEAKDVEKSGIETQKTGVVAKQVLIEE
ncbi:MAG: hypothetical protein A2289_24465 [Deltaproteobacteria bacterium RIFOXYA12_FULL_58_15]|nr:MAG: hypothetical protein A2289_24465 [Deltaproteobacteria bacterium RIFOXYA12_FULL_58_15]OGR12317.1 MAG: hypothetical protein A2341_26840 [Deltaproteobacteria bacterium RIFOXYB12_FULL_58_9]